MTIGVSEIARILDVDRELIKTWAYYFHDYLSAGANPQKGTTRVFTPDDLPLLAYVMSLWDEQSDTKKEAADEEKTDSEDRTVFEEIKCGLNLGYHLNEPYSNLRSLVVSVFQEPP